MSVEALIVPVTSSFCVGTVFPIPTLSALVINLTVEPSSCQPPPVGEGAVLPIDIVPTIPDRVQVTPVPTQSNPATYPCDVPSSFTSTAADA